MENKGTSRSYRSVDCNGFYLAWFSVKNLVILFLLPVSELSLVGLALA